ncbi:MAG: TlpA family protein disulfide reductase [Maribacter sp.]|nr:TlpA family protein disulfide reductase [Maribacter sp.]
MKSKLYTLAVILIFSLSCKDSGKEITKEQVNGVGIAKTEKATSLYVDLEGNPIALSDYKGKRILLNFWATWCRPCIEEMPALLKAQSRLEKEGYVFLLASDQSTETIKKFKAKKNFDFNFIKFTGSLAQLKIQALPTTFIYNEKGEKVDEITGGVEWDSQEIIGRLLKVE